MISSSSLIRFWWRFQRGYRTGVLMLLLLRGNRLTLIIIRNQVWVHFSLNKDNFFTVLSTTVLQNFPDRSVLVRRWKGTRQRRPLYSIEDSYKVHFWEWTRTGPDTWRTCPCLRAHRVSVLEGYKETTIYPQYTSVNNVINYRPETTVSIHLVELNFVTFLER